MVLKRGDICVLRVVRDTEEILKIDDWFWKSWIGAFSFLGD